MTKKYLFSGVLLLGICSCSQEHSLSSHAIDKFIAKESTSEIQPVEPLKLPSLIEYHPALYHAASQLSPFKPLEISDPILYPPREQFPLNSLKMVGHISVGSKRWALLKLPNDQIDQVTIGQKLGTEQLKIKAIEEERIVLEDGGEIPLTEKAGS